LDEPTNGLDPRGMREIRDLLFNLARDTQLTIFISSHLLSEIELLCNRVGIIDGGRMIAEGTVKELVEGRGSVQEVELGAADLEALREALKHISGITPVEGSEDSDRVRVGLVNIDPATLNRRLAEQGIHLSALVPVQRSLEELFLSLTKKVLT